MSKKGLNKIVLIITTIILSLLEVYSITTDSHFKYDFIFSMVLLVALYWYQDTLNLQPIPYALFGFFLVLHNLGTFDFYSLYPLGIEYDYWVHGLFGFVAALILRQFYIKLDLYPGVYQVIAILIVLLGLSALHELYEFAGAMILGEGEGVLFIGAGDMDPWDTQFDMLNNMIGGSIGLIMHYLSTKFSKK